MQAWIDGLTDAQLLALEFGVMVGGMVIAIALIMVGVCIDIRYGTHFVVPKE